MRVEAPALCCVAVPVILIQLYNTTVQSMHRNITRLVMFVESATAQQTSASWRDQKQLKLKAMENNFPSQMQFASCVSLSLPHSASLVEKGYLLFRQPRKPNHAPNTDSIGKSSKVVNRRSDKGWPRLTLLWSEDFLWRRRSTLLNTAREMQPIKRSLPSRSRRPPDRQ